MGEWVFAHLLQGKKTLGVAEGWGVVSQLSPTLCLSGLTWHLASWMAELTTAVNYKMAPCDFFTGIKALFQFADWFILLTNPKAKKAAARAEAPMWKPLAEVVELEDITWRGDVDWNGRGVGVGISYASSLDLKYLPLGKSSKVAKTKCQCQMVIRLWSTITNICLWPSTKILLSNTQTWLSPLK